MDDKLFQRGQAAGAILVAASYFLPWASVMSPLGSVQLRGLYVDYAWALLILALLHLLSQFARPNKDTLGLTEKSMKYVGLAWRLVPCALIGFFAWYAAKFVMGTHTTGGTAAAFGISLDSTVKAGLDYGYWIGAAGSILLVLSVGFLDHQIVRLISYAGVIAVVSIGLAYGFSLPGRHSNHLRQQRLAEVESAARNQVRFRPLKEIPYSRTSTLRLTCRYLRSLGRHCLRTMTRAGTAIPCLYRGSSRTSEPKRLLGCRGGCL